MDVDTPAEELASALGVDKQEVKEDLESLLGYSVPLEEAKQSIRRKHGGEGGGDAAQPESVALDEIAPGQNNVTVSVRVVTVGTRTIQYQGDEQTIREGRFGDETGTISYTAWQDFGFEAGDSLVVGNAGVREWEGEPELNLGSSTSVAMAEEPVETAAEIGGDSNLIELSPGDRGRNIAVQIQEVETRTIDGRNGETEILSGVVADETARLPFTDWDPHPEIDADASCRIEDVYVREYRGSPSINVSEFSVVTPLAESVAVTDDAPQLSLANAVDSGGLFDVEVVANVLEVRDGSGLIERCPECGRAIQNDQCRVHGTVDGEDDLRIKAILDDGTATVTAIIGSELTEEIYGGDMADAKEAARDAMDKGVVAETIREELVGDSYRVRGSLSIDEYGANLTVADFAADDTDPVERAQAVLAEVDG
ncbi:Single-stranded DNA binding protein [Halonotius pteroides]|uniref:Replication factor A n=1 Tax=Halonotius pteroides TaxID=268735 RepID=A0A3A6QEJ8_9EURY|nr:Single-stranded DNA binding protein [Halonotius pteroides]RJX51812.1 replication factor A [Halonotius pteroides]